LHRAGLHAPIRRARRRGRYCWEWKVHGHIRSPLDGLQDFLTRLQVQQRRLPPPFPGRLPAGGGETGNALTRAADRRVASEWLDTTRRGHSMAIRRAAEVHPTQPFVGDRTSGRSRPKAVDTRNSYIDDAGPPLQYAPLPSRTGDPILRLHLDRSTIVGEVAPHFLPHGAAYLLRQCCECLASGSPAAFKGAVIGIE